LVIESTNCEADAMMKIKQVTKKSVLNLLVCLPFRIRKYHMTRTTNSIHEMISRIVETVCQTKADIPLVDKLKCIYYISNPAIFSPLNGA
jgi:hypothetical protein